MEVSEIKFVTGASVDLGFPSYKVFRVCVTLLNLYNNTGGEIIKPIILLDAYKMCKPGPAHTCFINTTSFVSSAL